MTDLKNIDGHFYPPFHNGWGSFAEELFHYTSRYYVATEAFLRNITDDRSFVMSGYRAALLSPAQRDLMAAVLACRPDPDSARAVVSVVNAVLCGDDGVDAHWLALFADQLDKAARHESLAEQAHHAPHAPDSPSPLDPFLAIAERLLMPVAVRDRHVEVSLNSLARHLDSPSSALRTNLQNAVVDLHNAGYTLRNHPHLTHSEAQAIGDEGSV